MLVSRLLGQSLGGGPGRMIVRRYTQADRERGGVPGTSMPIKLGNRMRITLAFFIYGLSGFSAPFAILRFQYWKSAT